MLEAIVSKKALMKQSSHNVLFFLVFNNSAAFLEIVSCFTPESTGLCAVLAY